MQKRMQSPRPTSSLGDFDARDAPHDTPVRPPAQASPSRRLERLPQSGNDGRDDNNTGGHLGTVGAM